MLEHDGPKEEKRAVIRLNRSEAAVLAEVAVMILTARARAKDEQAEDVEVANEAVDKHAGSSPAVSPNNNKNRRRSK